MSRAGIQTVSEEGSASIWLKAEQEVARPQFGRPLQLQLPPIRRGLVEAAPSHVFWDGAGRFRFKLIQYPEECMRYRKQRDLLALSLLIQSVSLKT
jgi:hypothetical protein